MTEPQAGFYWHVHHEVLLEWCYNYEERADYIRRRKAPDEVGVRLRLFRPVQSPLCSALVATGEDVHRKWCVCEKAREEHEKARGAFNQHTEALNRTPQQSEIAWTVYRKLLRAQRRAADACLRARRDFDRGLLAFDRAVEENRLCVEAFHRRECPDCPWDGKTIFPKATR